MDNDSIAIVLGDFRNALSQALVAELNTELTGQYKEPGATHFALDPEQLAPGRGAFLVVYLEGAPVGCGAVRLLDANTAELKRMFIKQPLRGQGLGRRLVVALEQAARDLGARQLVLETGIYQLAALALYRAVGFQAIPLYGEYVSSPATSICLGKAVVIAPAAGG